jgi:hypothetical protein
MAGTSNVAKQIGQIFSLSSTLIISGSANAQGIILPYPPSQTTLGHELMLIVIGAVLGGFLGPVLTILDGWIGISPGVKQQKANYAVQRDIAASLRTLVTLQNEQREQTQRNASS